MIAFAMCICVDNDDNALAVMLSMTTMRLH